MYIRIVHGGIASLISCKSSLGKCFCAREKTVVELLIWRCLYSQLAFYPEIHRFNLKATLTSSLKL